MHLELRTENGSRGEDHALAWIGGAAAVIAVADGAGGTGSGAEAARLACERALALRDDARSWVERLVTIDDAVLRTGGQTTLVVIEIAHGLLKGASVGDSGAWLLRDPPVELTAGQARKPLLGSGEARPCAWTPTPFDAPVLVATDGLLGLVPSRDLGRLSVAELVAAVRLRSGAFADDLAVIKCHPR